MRAIWDEESRVRIFAAMWYQDKTRKQRNIHPSNVVLIAEEYIESVRMMPNHMGREYRAGSSCTMAMYSNQSLLVWKPKVSPQELDNIWCTQNPIKRIYYSLSFKQWGPL